MGVLLAGRGQPGVVDDREVLRWRGGGAGPVETRPHLVLFLHDEVAEEQGAGDFPLTVSVVRSYADAGKSGAPPTVGP